MNVLFLLMKEYPFGHAESFIESEIGYLAERFDSVYIVATAVKRRINSVRETPGNVQVIRMHTVSDRKVRYAWHTVAGMGHISQADLRRELQERKGIKAKIAALYLYGRAKRICKAVRLTMARQAIPAGSDIRLYSYWLSDTALAAGMLKNGLGKRYQCGAVSRAHGYDLYDGRNLANCNPFRAAYMSALDGIYPCSRDGQGYLSDQYPQFKEKIRTRYLGTEDHGISMANEPGERFTIATCSSVDANKNLSTLAGALALLEGRGVTNISWICIGDGSGLSELKNDVRASLRETDVRFYGRLTNKEVMSLYKQERIDLFVNVSLREGLPVSIMEAISFGMPVIATDAGGTREIVEDKVNGLLLNSNVTATEIADSLEGFMKQGARAAQAYRSNARRIWSERFSADKNYGEFAREIANHSKCGVDNEQ